MFNYSKERLKMSEESSMTYTEMSEHAFKGAAEYLQLAIRHVDQMEGWGGAIKNPQLVAALVQAAATEFNSMMLSHRVSQSLDRVTEAVAEVSDVGRDVVAGMGE